MSPDTPARAWRLLIDGEADGAWNMAVDEALLESQAGPDASERPTLRLYSWRPGTLSLGKRQSAQTSHSPEFLRRAGIGLVRRPTGGGAVLHELERTYAVVGRLGEPPFPGGVVAGYRLIAGALRDALSALGAKVEVRPAAVGREGAEGPVCFETASVHELTVAGRKIVGSAQLRRRGAFLQHGSIPVRLDGTRLARAVGQDPPARGFVDLERALGRTPAPVEIDAALIAAFETRFRMRFERKGLSPVERRRAMDLLEQKYATDGWTLGVRPTEVSAARES